jgi:invasion protein IalB
MMNNDLSGGPSETSGRSASRSTGLYWVFGGSVLLAAIFGGLVVFFLMRAQAGGPAAQPAVQSAQSQATGQAATAASQPAAPGQAAPPVWQTVATYGSWQMRCQQANPKQCSALLEVVDKKTRQVLFAWVVGVDNKGALQTLIQTASGVLVSSGIDIKMGTAVHHVNFATCIVQGCSAATVMDAAFVNDMLKTPKADVVIYAANGRSLDFGLPMAGFDKVMAALQK